MKRSEALAILSREHHQALFVAQKLRRATEESAAAERQRFLEFWEGHGRRHFQLEEDLLLPAYARHGDARDPLVLRVLADHVEIRAAAGQVARQPRVTPDALEELGHALSEHVRLEERELFPLIESAMPEAELVELAQALQAADQEPDPTDAVAAEGAGEAG